VQNFAGSFQHLVLSMLAPQELGNQLVSHTLTTDLSFLPVLAVFNDFSFA